MNLPNPLPSVEGDLNKVLRAQLTAAGRTDKDVSAISQIVSFKTSNVSLTAFDIVNKFNNSLNYSEDSNLVVYQCARVPKMFNARSQATWRRYLYTFPLNCFGNNKFDVDLEFINRCLNKY